MEIVNKKILSGTSDTVVEQIEVSAPEISSKARAGQFIVLMVSDRGERIPLTIVNADKNKGTITLIYQVAGYTTSRLSALKQGDSLFSLSGPLGKATELCDRGRIIVVGGGVGIAEAYPVIKGFKEYGSKVEVILGARTKDLLILRDEIKEIADDLFLVTDDGSIGDKGFVTEKLKKCIENAAYDFCYCVGPVPMMAAVCGITKEAAIKTDVCVATIMVDGTGMCGSCRLTVAGKMKFCCVDGPEFDGHEVDFGELMSRQKRFAGQEKNKCSLGTAPGCRLKEKIDERNI